MSVCFSKLGSMGRLGNSLFQIAATISLAARNNDTYQFPRWTYYENDFPNLKNCFVDNLPKQPHVYTEPYFHYKEIPYKKDIDLCGYFQSWRYFQDQEGLIRHLFEFKNRYERQDATAIHCRLGDYVKLGQDYYIDLMKTDYYEKAMDIVKADKYLIFSDDIDFCTSKFVGNKFEFVKMDSDVDELSLMASCTNQIIANSSFSWCGAWLNDNPNKTVIAPSQWFGPKLAHDTKDLIPKEWLVL